MLLKRYISQQSKTMFLHKHIKYIEMGNPLSKMGAAGLVDLLNTIDHGCIKTIGNRL